MTDAAVPSSASGGDVEVEATPLTATLDLTGFGTGPGWLSRLGQRPARP